MTTKPCRTCPFTPNEFAVLDLARLRNVRVATGEATSWVDAGTTLSGSRMWRIFFYFNLFNHYSRNK
jgi:hypothetical protein